MKEYDLPKEYEPPRLFIDEYAADTMIASYGSGYIPKNGNAGNNQNCWGPNQTYAAINSNGDACYG